MRIRFGCANPNNAAAQLECLRQVNATQLANCKFCDPLWSVFIPMVDGVEITAQPMVMFSRGKFNHVR